MKPGLLPATAGALGLGLLTALLPALNDAGLLGAWGLALSYALVALVVTALIAGLLTLAEDGVVTTPAVLLSGAGAAILGSLAILFGGNPVSLQAPHPGPSPLVLLFFANVLLLAAATAFGLALARQITAPGVALLVAAVAAASDLFSIFAGPTKTLLAESSPALDYLLLIFPTPGYPLGFAIGAADFLFFALFAALAARLPLRPLLTLASCGLALSLALLAGLFLQMPLPALPFLALFFVLPNADLLVRPRAHHYP